MLLRHTVFERVEAARRVLAARSDLVCAYLFGSILDERRERIRDVDVAVLGRGPLSFGRLGDLHIEMTRSFSTDDVDIVDLCTAHRRLRHEILSRGRLLVALDPGATTRFRERTLREHLACRHLDGEYYRRLRRELYRSYVETVRPTFPLAREKIADSRPGTPEKGISRFGRCGDARSYEWVPCDPSERHLPISQDLPIPLSFRRSGNVQRTGSLRPCR